MGRRRARKRCKTTPIAWIILRSALLACVFTAACVLIYALLLKEHVMDESSLTVVNVLIKAVCACVAGLICKPAKEYAVLYAGISGGSYIILAFAVFSIAQGAYSFHFSQITDIALGFMCAAGVRIILSLLENMNAARA